MDCYEPKEDVLNQAYRYWRKMHDPLLNAPLLRPCPRLPRLQSIERRGACPTQYQRELPKAHVRFEATRAVWIHQGIANTGYATKHGWECSYGGRTSISLTRSILFFHMCVFKRSTQGETARHICNGKRRP